MLKPLFARVLIKRDKLKTSGIIVPQMAQKRNAPCRGVVIAKGPTADDSIEVGKTYVFGIHAGGWFNEDGTPSVDEGKAEFFVCQDEDLVAEVVDG